MEHRLHVPRVHGLLPHAVVATAVVVGLPAAVVVALSAIGLPEPQVILAGVLGMIFSIGTAALGTTMWIKRPESVDVSFGELMLWRFFRRHRAEKTIDESTARLGLVSAAAPALDVSPRERLDILHDLASALEAKDPYTGGHSRRVERHAYRTGCALHLSPDDIEDLRLAASLHDVGKIRIPDRVLRKPGALDEEEIEMVREHSMLGARMVAPAASDVVVDAIRHHHECWDGAGYPMGLKGEEIPLFARVIAVSDAYDAMTSARPYKNGMSRKEAIEVLEAAAGRQFDPDVVDAFVTTLPTALPAAGALLIFAGPASAAKKASAWLRSVGAGSVTSAAGTAGVAAIVGVAGVTGVFDLDRSALRPPVARAAPAIVEAVDASAGVRPITVKTPPRKPAEPRAEVLSSGLSAEEPGAGRSAQQSTQPAAITGQPVQGPAAAPPVTEPKEPNQGNSSPPSEPAGPKEEPAKPQQPSEPEEPVEAAEKKNNGHEPHGDPQPDKGQDCPADDEGHGKGRERHCS